jgi:hypothetical protein
MDERMKWRLRVGVERGDAGDDDAQPNPYLVALEAFDLRPNFWCSSEYFRRAGWREVLTENFVWVEDDEGQVVLPPINTMLGHWVTSIDRPVWAGIGGAGFAPVNAHPEFLDYEFIYDPAHFTDLSGIQWRKFRKNSRKFPARVPGCIYYQLDPADHIPELKDCLEAWLDGVKDDEIHDSDVMVDYALHGQNRAALIHRETGRIYGVNVWDFNHRVTNYRYCIADPDPGLFASEYLRLMFYRDHHERFRGWKVNDGGVLDRPGLEEFKRSLNPIEVNIINSWKLKED